MSPPLPPDMPGDGSSSPALTGETDPFRPPKANTRVYCMHCHEKYDSYRIEWREAQAADGSRRGLWCCPTPGCGGKGFLLDIHPTDPNWQDEEGRGMVGGWFDDEGNPVPPPFGEAAW